MTHCNYRQYLEAGGEVAAEGKFKYNDSMTPEQKSVMEKVSSDDKKILPMTTTNSRSSSPLA